MMPNLNLSKLLLRLGIVGLFAGIGAGTPAAHAAIFGADNRSAIRPSSPVQPLARATAIAVLSANASVNAAGGIDLDTDVLQNFCKDEPLALAPSLSYSCTGFLIAPDLLVTAGHCVYALNTPKGELRNEKKLACESFSWLFDFQQQDNWSLQTKNIDPSKLFRCKEIVYAVQQEKAPYLDYALIRLDRAALGRTPMKLNSSALLPDASLSLIGFPYGTSMKLSVGGRILANNPARQSYITNLDAFEGNSGGPVLNSKNEVVGILIGGTPAVASFLDKQNSCERFNRCSEYGSNCAVNDKDLSLFPGFQRLGSEVQRIAPLEALLRASVLKR